ncbi:hypothetical protein JAK51_22290 [Stenotrophomonas maltophilia]|uniref:hypothetical protein n=1 Tax=Stenotrophomonas maltophilia TaxID=40324 RepID=UPI0021CA8B36|nr:hypothetical protein [Stenotrophomonas maltophilia]MCU1128939.1 hypothetical protein [Stenotrophomonas maltophilia]
MEPNYKRVRRTLQDFSLEDSLVHIWQYSRLISGGVPLPVTYNHQNAGTPRRIEKHVHAHELDLLAREMVLHASRSEKPAKSSISTWEGAAAAFNAIKEYAGGIVDLKNEDVMLVLHRIAHQQFPKFSRLSHSKIGRYLSLYRHDQLRTIFERRLGITVESYFILAMAVLGSAVRKPHMNTTTDFSILGVDLDQSRAFFGRIAGHVDVIANKLRQDQKLDGCWEYTLNALHFLPLVALDEAHMERVLCPLPPALEARLIEGIFFDIYERGSGFENAYGSAVEALVGRMLQALPDTYTVRKPDPITLGKQVFHLSDWIVKQGISSAYIECKAKRIALKGRVAATLDDLRAELQFLADAVVQNYANMLRTDKDIGTTGAIQGRAYCLVVTLEDWILFSDSAFSTLHALVAKGLAEKNMPANLPDIAPYLILSAETFQSCVQALSLHSMEEVFGSAEHPDYKGWAFSTYLHRHFPNLDAQHVGGFDAEAHRLFEPFMTRFQSPQPPASQGNVMPSSSTTTT